MKKSFSNVKIDQFWSKNVVVHEVQLQREDLPPVLRAPAPWRDKLPQEALRLNFKISDCWVQNDSCFFNFFRYKLKFHFFFHHFINKFVRNFSIQIFQVVPRTFALKRSLVTRSEQVLLRTPLCLQTQQKFYRTQNKNLAAFYSSHRSLSDVCKVVLNNGNVRVDSFCQFRVTSEMTKCFRSFSLRQFHFG